MQHLALTITFYAFTASLAVYMLVGAYRDFSNLKGSETLPENWQRFYKNNIKIQLTGAIVVAALILYVAVAAQ